MGAAARSVTQWPAVGADRSTANSPIGRASKDKGSNMSRLSSIRGKEKEPAVPVETRFVPRTGIDQPFLLEPPKHIRETAEYERTNETSCMMKASVLDDYRVRDTGRLVNLAKTVFDIERDSPHYKTPGEYLNPKDQVKFAP